MTLRAKLVVLGGAHDGAIAAIDTSVVLVGSAPTCDILLRDPGIMPLHASISVTAHTTVVREHMPVPADAATDAEPANRGVESETEWYVPFRIGPTWVAIAPLNFDWGATEPLPSNPRDEAVAAVLHGRGSRVGSLRRRVGSARLRAAGLALAVICLGLLLVGVLAMVMRTPGSALLARQPFAAGQISVTSLNRIIADLKLPDLTVGSIGRRPAVVGFVKTREEFASLVHATRDAPVDGLLLRVQVGDEVAQRARGFLDDRGITADYQGGGRIRVSGRPLDTRSYAAMAQKLGRLRADVGDSIQIVDALDYAEMEQPNASPTVRPMPVRIAEVQADPPAHFRTADGARYFVGATLPDGAQVVRIGSDEILFRRENRLIRYRVVE